MADTGKWPAVNEFRYFRLKIIPRRAFASAKNYVKPPVARPALYQFHSVFYLPKPIFNKPRARVRYAFLSHSTFSPGRILLQEGLISPARTAGHFEFQIWTT